MGIGTAARNYLVLSRVEEREHQRKVVESWFLTLPGISESDKKMMERSQKYNLGVSLVRFIVLEMLFLCLFAFYYYCLSVVACAIFVLWERGNQKQTQVWRQIKTILFGRTDILLAV